MAPTLDSALAELRERGIVMCVQQEPVLGRHGKCYLARFETTGERLWVKHCYPSADAGRHEIQILCQLGGMEGVPKIVHVVHIEDDKTWMYVMTTVGECAVNLAQFVEKNMVDIDQNLPIILQSVYEVCARLLARGYVQIDMKPTNFVIDCKTLKVMMIDFGAVYQLEGDGPYVKHEFKGLTWASGDVYRAPETGSDEQALVPGDHVTWCFGMIVHYLATGVEAVKNYTSVRGYSCTPPSTINLGCNMTQTESVLRRILLRCLTTHPYIRVKFHMISLLLSMYRKKDK